jgi:putative NADH-flavin reductase
MTTIAIFGGTGYAGGAIAGEAVRRGHRVISVTRSGTPAGGPGEGTRTPRPDAPGVDFRQGNVHDAALVDRVAAEADVVAPDSGGARLSTAFPALTAACAAHGTRLGVVGGAASLLVSDGGPRLIDTPEFPDAFKAEAGSAAAVLDELRADSTGVDWFFVSPAREFGAYSPGEPLGRYRVGGDVLLTDESGRSHISGSDFALAIVDEIENPKHHRTRFTVAY